MASGGTTTGTTQQTPGQLLYLGFNQDYGCFACGTDTGFKIFNCDPFKETFQREFSKGGIGHVEMLFRCNILALVGGGQRPQYPPTKVMIWDDNKNRCIGELSFRTDVKSVKLRRDRVVVVLETKIYVYMFANLKLVDHIETRENKTGLCALCPYSNNMVLACPGLEPGSVRIELYDRKKTTVIPAAHNHPLACMALNSDGSRLATASVEGTLIRIFDTMTGERLQEVRRGMDHAQIYSICFSNNSNWLAASSDKGTVHIFSIDGKEAKQEKNQASNRVSSFNFMSSVLPSYFSSQWSFAQYRVPDLPQYRQTDRVPDPRTIVSFGADNSLIVISANGIFYKAVFDPNTQGSECVTESHARFMQIAAATEEQASA